MCKYPRPDFIKEGKGFSIVYFSKAIKFLIDQGALDAYGRIIITDIELLNHWR